MRKRSLILVAPIHQTHAVGPLPAVEEFNYHEFAGYLFAMISIHYKSSTLS